MGNFGHFTPCSSVSIVNFEQLNIGWENRSEKSADHETLSYNLSQNCQGLMYLF